VGSLRVVSAPPAKPLLVFDGDCGFCRFWVARWRHRVGDAAEFQPFQNQDIAARFPEIPRQRFASAVHLIETDGRVFEAAEAVFRLFAARRRTARGPALVTIYERVPGAAAICEAAYRFVANHRSFFGRVTALLWDAAPGNSSALARWCFLRLLGVVYLAAFWSLATQIVGLIGHDGILPADEYMDRARAFVAAENIGLDRYRLLPTVCWLGASDAVLRALCLGGVALAALLVIGILPIVVLPLLWIDYLSLSVVGRDFLSFQWDALLLETGLLGILIAPLTLRERPRSPVDAPRLGVWLMLWLLFRLMFGSGAVKLASGDPTWRNLTALLFHYETQPIPTPLAWYAHHLPAWLNKGSTAAVLAVELIVPFFIFGSRRLRHAAFGLLIGLQITIALTGNYAFFNLLAAALCVLLLADGRPWSARLSRGGLDAHVFTVRRVLSIVVAAVTVPVSALALAGRIGLEFPFSPLASPVAEVVAPFRSVNSYGLFAVMTTTRPEIIIEGSGDGIEWKAYEFAYKAGDLHRRPPWVAPHQPRLDWQMWFAALSSYDAEPWFQRFCRRLLEGSPDVLRLLAYDPFEGRAPRFVRATLYRYRFSGRAERRTDGVWWTREPLGEYSPVLSLNGEGLPRRLR